MKIEIQIGKDVHIAWDSIIKAPLTTIGDHTRINGKIIIGGGQNCEIGKYCAIGYGVHIITTNHNTNYANLQIALNRKNGWGSLESGSKPVKIGNNVWIGDNVIILPEVTIGDGAVIGAGSVVTHDISPFMIAYGVPAKEVKPRISINNIPQLLRIKWWDWSEEKIKRNKAFFQANLLETMNLDELEEADKEKEVEEAMKIDLVSEPKVKIELQEKEAKLLLQCLNYCWHRLKEHDAGGRCGLGGIVEESWVNHTRTQLANKIGW